MKVEKAEPRFDEPVTAAGLKLAIHRGRARGQGVRASAAQYLPALKSLLIGFADRTAVVVPVKNYPELAALSLTELKHLSVGFGGSALCLQARDLHVSIAGLISASPHLMDMATTVAAGHNGRRTSASKVRASRENGRKGGRPRKLPSAA